VHKLTPVEYVYKPEEFFDPWGTSEGVVEYSRIHCGLVAQQVRDALTSSNVDPADYGIWCMGDPSNLESRQMLRYEELIGPMISTIQMSDVHVRFDGDFALHTTDLRVVPSGSHDSTGCFQITHTLGRPPYVQVSVQGTDATPLLAYIVGNDDTTISIRVSQWDDNSPADPLQLFVHIR